MSTLKEFEGALLANRELAERYEQERKRIADEGGLEDDASVISQAAEALGFTLTQADFERAYADEQELDDAELEWVAGGVDECNDWCVMIENCYTAFFHTDADPNDVYGTPAKACWSDYTCVFFNH